MALCTALCSYVLPGLTSTTLHTWMLVYGSYCSLRFGDCFSGAGGLSIGLEAAGLEPVFAVESNPVYQRTFMRAHPTVKLYRQSVSSFLQLLGSDGYPQQGSIDVLVGGSPCQPYSLMNTLGDFATDTRKDLVWEFLAVLAKLAPPYFVLENVPAFLIGRQSADPRNVRPSPMPRLLSTLISMGYQARCVVMNAAHYGVPQSRNRLFVLAAKHGYQLPAAPPPVTHYFQRGTVGSNDFGGEC